jgi:hypothetical protein
MWILVSISESFIKISNLLTDSGFVKLPRCPIKFVLCAVIYITNCDVIYKV